jgi:hypothetical protein
MNTEEAKKYYGAQYYQTMKDGVTPQMFYRWKTVKYNDGTTGEVFQYLTSFDNWHNSSEKNPEEFVKKLVKL